MTLDLLRQPWYHGNIPRSKAERLVVKDGDFLLRDSTTQLGGHVLTCFWHNRPLHFALSQQHPSPGRVRFGLEGEWHASIPLLVQAHRRTRRPLSAASGAVLGHAVSRNVLLEYYDSRSGCMRSSGSPRGSPALTRRRAERSGSLDLLDDGADLTSTRCKRTGSEPLLSPGPASEMAGQFFPREQEAAAPPPKPSRLPSLRRSQKPHVAIRNLELYEDDGKDYTDYAQVKAWPAAVKRMTSATREADARKAVLLSHSAPPLGADDYDVPRPSEASLDVVPTKLPKAPPASTFDLDTHQSDFLPPQNKPLEASAVATMKMILLESPSDVLARHIACLDLDLLGWDREDGSGVRSGLQLMTLPQGRQMRADALER